jgi:hypothetical protein
MENIIHLCPVGVGQNKELTPTSKNGTGQISDLNSWNCGWGTMLTIKPCWGRGWPARTKVEVKQQSCCMVTKETCLTTLENLVVEDHRARWQLVLWADTAPSHRPASWRDHFRDSASTRWPITPKKYWAQPPWADFLQCCPTKRGNIHCYSPTYQPWEGTGTLRKSQWKESVLGFDAKWDKSRAFSKLIFSFPPAFYLVFLILLLLFSCIYS